MTNGELNMDHMAIKKDQQRKRFRRLTLVVIGLALLLKLFPAATTDLGNDEVYYILYAMFPDWSHFDHPPMTGLFIQLSSLNLLLRHEIFIRLSAILSAAGATWFLYLLTEKIRSPRAGFYAALLFSASGYASIIAGLFILPDAPQMLFWLAALYFFHDPLTGNPEERGAGKKMLLAGLFTGLGMLSKYTATYLWAGVGLYVLLYNRPWLKKIALYLSGLLSLLLFSPVILWNRQYHFVSFTFQGSRATFEGIRLDFFLLEIVGEFFYNNPVVVVLMVITLIHLVRGKSFCPKNTQRLLLLLSIPMILLFWGIALSRRTLPHWTGPAFFPLMILTACRFDHWKQQNHNLIPRGIRTALLSLCLFLTVSWIQIKTGFIPLTTYHLPDPTLDLYGWDEEGRQFRAIRQRALAEGVMEAEAPIFSHRWFPAANYEYYFAHDAGIEVMGINLLPRLHKYAWINEERGPFQRGMNGWAIHDPQDYFKPDTQYKGLFKEITCYDSICIRRGRKIAKKKYVYLCKGMVYLPVRTIPVSSSTPQDCP
ncbi:MAG: hypothetical protein CSA95_03530 [Bacteroidetes bacterium]|nr:MAG: hypothetical protein CSA95_03530 [Bacteroidota bacterium]PIE88484.1 MAG: hypothetical protein CSA04_01675 [Bacteroidota bacterium]